MISFRFTQCDTERVGRTMTLTKPALRTSLGDLHFKQACWVAFNSPGFHEVDIDAFVHRWRADGHLSAVMKDQGSAERAKEGWLREYIGHLYYKWLNYYVRMSKDVALYPHERFPLGFSRWQHSVGGAECCRHSKPREKRS